MPLDLLKVDKSTLGQVAMLRHIRNLLLTTISCCEVLNIFGEEAIKELVQNVRKAITVCDNELSKYK